MHMQGTNSVIILIHHSIGSRCVAQHLMPVPKAKQRAAMLPEY